MGMVLQIKGDAAGACDRYRDALAIYQKWGTFKPREQQLQDRINQAMLQASGGV